MLPICRIGVCAFKGAARHIGERDGKHKMNNIKDERQDFMQMHYEYQHTPTLEQGAHHYCGNWGISFVVIQCQKSMRSILFS